jgi:YegS/Rv2252/BmrU family lipid kinase
MRERTVALIANPAARRGRQAAREAADALRAFGLAVEIAFTRGPEDAADLARVAAERGVDSVVAVGGDGTLCQVVSGVLASGRGVPVGVVPAGTGNDTAKGIGIPLETQNACRTIARGAARPLDVLLAGERPFLGLAMVGFAADVGATVNRWKSGPWRFSAVALGGYTYPLAAVHHMLFRSRPIRCSIEAAGADPPYRYEGEAFTVLIGNQPGVGGVFLPCPRASCTDGLMDLCVARARKPDQRLLGLADKSGTLRRVATGEHLGLPWVDYCQTARELRIRMDEPRALVADGEEFGEVTDLLIRALPGAIRVLVPSDSGDGSQTNGPHVDP